jgi:hypothetical protein
MNERDFTFILLAWTVALLPIGIYWWGRATLNVLVDLLKSSMKTSANLFAAAKASERK